MKSKNLKIPIVLIISDQMLFYLFSFDVQMLSKVPILLLKMLNMEGIDCENVIFCLDGTGLYRNVYQNQLILTFYPLKKNFSIFVIYLDKKTSFSTTKSYRLH